MNPKVFHITHVDNLDTILVGGLRCFSQMDSRRIRYRNIAHKGIQDRRAETKVPLPPYGNLHDYVPFYFAPRSPMLYAIKGGWVEDYSEGQNPVIYLATTIQRIRNAGLQFVFTDGHATMRGLSEFYSEISDLKEIDWEIMRSKYWNDTLEDGDRKRRRQAEFLVHQLVPLEVLAVVVTIDLGTKGTVERILESRGHSIPVIVHRDWYY